MLSALAGLGEERRSEVIEMGNTYIEKGTKDNLLEYTKEYGHKSPSRGIDALLAEHRELLATRRECELLHRLFEPYKLDEEDVVL